MEAVKAYYDGAVFVPIEPVSARRNQQAVITILDFVESAPTSADRRTTEAPSPNYALKLEFLDGPPLPDSFFDPLPEEDLQAWGL
jgi:hypothetical protein